MLSDLAVFLGLHYRMFQALRPLLPELLIVVLSYSTRVYHT